MFARIKPLGWGFQEILTSGQMTQLDIDHANAVDGVAGGDYAAPLGFSHLQNTQVDGYLAVGNSAVVSKVAGSLYIGDKGIACDGGISVGQYVSINGAHPSGWGLQVAQLAKLLGALDVTGAALLRGTVDVEGLATFAGGLDIHESQLTIESLSSLRVDGLLDVEGTALFAGDVTLDAIVTPTSEGRVRHRSILGQDLTRSYSIGDANIIVSPGVTGAKTWTIATTDAGDGDWMLIMGGRQTGVAGSLTITWGGASFTIPNSATVFGGFVRLAFIAGAWHCSGASAGVTGTGD